MFKCLKSRLTPVALFSRAISLPAGPSMVVALFVLLLSLSANAQTPQKPNTDSVSTIACGATRRSIRYR